MDSRMLLFFLGDTVSSCESVKFGEGVAWAFEYECAFGLVLEDVSFDMPLVDEVGYYTDALADVFAASPRVHCLLDHFEIDLGA